MSNVTPITVAYGDGIGPEISSKNGTTSKQTVALLNRVPDQGIEIVKTGKAGYTLAQGQ